MKSFPRLRIFNVILTVMALTSCSENSGIEGWGNEYNGREMVFSASPEMTGDSRGSLGDLTARVSSSTIILKGDEPGDSLFCSVAAELMNSRPLSRGSYNNGQADFSQMSVTAVMRKTSDNSRSYYFTNVVYSRTSDTDAGNLLNLWQCEDIHYWWGKEENYTFYAVAPWNVQSAGLDINASGVTPLLTYTVPATPDRQVDLLAVETPEYPGDHNKSVPLQFRHLLSAIEIRQGTGMRAGTITSVTFKNVKGSGNYSFTDGWTLGSQVNDYSLEGNFTAADNASLTGDKNILFLLPQSLDGAEVEVTLEHNGATKRYSTALSGSWVADSRYTYTITINPEFKFEPESDIIDAHYEKFAVTVTPDAVKDGDSWTLGSTVEGVTFLSDADYTSKAQYSLARQGFWTDRILDGNNGNRDSGSARGESTITFTGNTPQKVWVFVPEHTGTADRIITLSAATVNGSPVVYDKVMQYAAFGANDGWEQTANSAKGAYGFCWDLLVSYQLVYSGDNTFGQNRENYCNNLITANNASNYAKTQRFWYSSGGRRYCITLDYSKLSNLTVALSETDGLTNTKALYNFGKGASTASFETVIDNTLKTEEGKTTEKAFRKMTSSDVTWLENWANFGNNGSPVTGSDAVGEILKKNKYNIVRNISSGGGIDVISYDASLSENDIVWYLPAVNEFTSAPTTVVDQIDKGGWSSTAISGATNSYLGNRTSTNRKTVAAIRARRAR